MTSEIPKKPKTGNNHVFVGLAVAMLLATGGLITWKVTRDSNPEPAATTAVAEEEAPARNSPPPPPPPAEEPATEPSAPALASAVPIRSGKSPCAAECTGEGSAALRSALAARGGMSRRCYEKQLAQNASLSGKMTVHMKIAPNGQVCSANITNDTIGDGGLANCVLGVFRTSTFPASPGGCVEANAPLNFVPKK